MLGLSNKLSSSDISSSRSSTWVWPYMRLLLLLGLALFEDYLLSSSSKLRPGSNVFSLSDCMVDVSPTLASGAVVADRLAALSMCLALLSVLVLDIYYI
jgi:hypothetical protein